MKKYFLPFAAILILASCEDVIDVKLNEQDTNLYAIEARITSMDEPWVFVSRGLPVSMDEEYQGVSNAIVTISDNDVPSNRLVLVEDAVKKGYYSVPGGTDYLGKTGRKYTITIETGDVVLTASDVLSPVEKIDSISIRPSMRGDMRFLGIFTYGQETPGIGNYYKWDIYVNDTLINDASRIVVVNDEIVDGNYVNAFEIFTDYYNLHNPDERLLKYGDTIYVKQLSTSKFAFDYFTQLVNQSMGGGLFSVPAANIQGNFTSSDGKEVLGLFTAHDVSVSNHVVINDRIENELRQ